MDVSGLITALFGGTNGSNFDEKAKQLGLDPTDPTVVTGLKKKLDELENMDPTEAKTMGAIQQNMNQQKMVRTMMNYYADKYKPSATDSSSSSDGTKPAGNMPQTSLSKRY